MEWVKAKQLQKGQYIIEKVLGSGGFGITYLAARTSNRQLVAIKTVNKMVQDSSNFARCQQEFENEARRLQQCRHPHIVSVHELFQEGQLWCMVMEYISGENLASYVDKQGILSEPKALHYIRQIGEALIEVHKNGLLHRDVKPRNIMLRFDNSEAAAVLIDFGAAREFTHNHTQTHTELMSQGFAPYEQYFRKHKRGAYTDVYATAATLYFMMTGKVPPNALERKEGERLVPPKQLNRRISDRVNEAIVKGMALEANDRPQSMQEWLKLLEPQVITPPTVIIPWKSLIIVFIAYVVAGWFLAYGSARLWVLAVIGSVAMAMAGSGAVAMAVAVVVAVVAVVVVVFVAIAVVAAVVAAVVVAVTVAVAMPVVAAVVGVGPVAVAVAREKLLESFSRFHTFLILAATSELSLGVGWFVYLMIFPKR